MDSTKQLKVINLFGGPGSGKSTTAAGLFFLMKLSNYDVDLVLEYAKYLTWANKIKTFEEYDEQGYIFAKQNHRLKVLVGQTEWAITDCSLLLSSLYGKDQSTAFHTVVKETYNKYTNINIFVNRVKEYNPIGRTQSEKEARTLATNSILLLRDLGLDYHFVDGDINAPAKILKIIKEIK